MQRNMAMHSIMERGIYMVVSYSNRTPIRWLLVMMVLVAASCSCWAEESTGQAAPATTVITPTSASLPDEWQELGQLLMTIIDQRSEQSLTMLSDTLIRQRVGEALTTFEQKLASSDSKLEDLNSQVKALVEELRSLLLVHDQQLNDLDMKLATFTDQSSKDLAASANQLKITLEQKIDEQAKQIAQLQAENAKLSKRFWVSTGAAALGIILAIALK